MTFLLTLLNQIGLNRTDPQFKTEIYKVFWLLQILQQLPVLENIKASATFLSYHSKTVLSYSIHAINIIDGFKVPHTT